MPPDRKPCTPLLPNKYLGTKTGEAYDKCLDLEKRAEWSPSQGEHAMPPCLAARILGCALLFAPCDSGRNTLTWEILACHNDLALKNLADMYTDGLIRAFRNPVESHTPVISSDESPLLSVKNMSYLLEKPTINFQELRTLVMSRDEYHCVFTGALDYAYFKRVRRDLTSRPKATETLQLAHIISQPIPADNIEDDSESVGKKANYVSPEGALLERFAGVSLCDILGNENVQSPLNAFMASAQVHNMFDSLELWLVPAQDKDEQLHPNTYDVKSTVAPEDFPIIGYGLKSRITFKTCQVGAKAILPPDPRLLAVHAACAQIANMSGAAEYLDEFFQDSGEISAMTQPGAVSELTRALRGAKLIPTTA